MEEETEDRFEDAVDRFTPEFARAEYLESAARILTNVVAMQRQNGDLVSVLGAVKMRNRKLQGACENLIRAYEGILGMAANWTDGNQPQRNVLTACHRDYREAVNSLRSIGLWRNRPMTSDGGESLEAEGAEGTEGT